MQDIHSQARAFASSSIKFAVGLLEHSASLDIQPSFVPFQAHVQYHRLYFLQELEKIFCQSFEHHSDSRSIQCAAELSEKLGRQQKLLRKLSRLKFALKNLP